MQSAPTHYAPSRQPQYHVPLPPHRQASGGSSGSYPSPSDTTSQHSPGPNYYGHRSNPSLGSTSDVKREYDEPAPARNSYYTSNGYGYSASGNSGYGAPPSSTQYYQPSSQGGHYQTSPQYGPGSSNFGYNSMYVFFHSGFLFLRLTDVWSRSRCADSPPVSPVTSTPTPDYFVPQSSSSSASSPTSPASPVNGYHYSWQPQPTHPSDGSSGHYTPTDLPPQYNPFQPCVYRVIRV